MFSRQRLIGTSALLVLGHRQSVGDRLFAQGPTHSKESDDQAALVATDERIDRALGRIRTVGDGLPGMIAAIVHGAEPGAIGVSGFRKVGSPEPIRPGDLMHLGSCTKAMTATMIATLVDEGKLGWSSTIDDIFPDQPTIHPDFRKVTLDQLLSHRAGLPHDAPWWILGRGLPITQQRRIVLTSMLREAPKDRPGSRFAYSNVGYVLAGLMAEKVGAASWEELMRRRLFRPLGMTSAGFGPPGKPGLVVQPWGHRSEGKELRPVQEDNPPVMGPAGTVHCSLADWSRFASLHLRNEVHGRPFLRPETFRALQKPDPGEDYVGGWNAVDRSWAGGRALNHSGSNTTWYCSIWLAPAHDLGLLVATNAGGERASLACDEAIGELIRIAGPAKSPRE